MQPKRLPIRVGVLLSAALLAAGSPASGEPAVPEDARRFFIQANQLFKQARDQDDYVEAAKLYQKALSVVPGWGDAWYRLGATQEKLERYDDAIQALQKFLAFSPKDKEARAAQDHIYQLEAVRDTAIRRANSPEGRADSLRRRFTGYIVKKVWCCRIVDKSGQRGCSEEEAAGSHWDGDWCNVPEGGFPITVSLIGDNHNILSLSYRPGLPAACIPAMAYQSARDTYRGEWYFCPRPEINEVARTIDKLDLNASWNGSRAIYIESCSNGSGICWRTYSVLGQ